MPLGKKYGGRTKGTPNKTTREVREWFNLVFRLLQKDPNVNLLEWAKANPTEFYKLAARLIPTQVTGAEGKAIEIRAVRDFEALPVKDLEAIEAILTKPKEIEGAE
jgi:hypothetical protein